MFISSSYTAFVCFCSRGGKLISVECALCCVGTSNGGALIRTHIVLVSAAVPIKFGLDYILKLAVFVYIC